MSVNANQLESLLCMVVDDDAHCRSLLMASLKSVGVKQVISASSGSEAFDMLRQPNRMIDVVLCDIRMPKGNGLQLLQALRTGQIKSMRVNATFVLVTAFPTNEYVAAASSLDANGFVVKPVVPERLEAALLKARRTVFPPAVERYTKVSLPVQP